MAWETKWQAPVAVDTRSDAQKIFDDQIMYGRSFSMDGKHIPIEDVLIHKPEYKTQPLKLGNKIIQVIVVGDLGLDFCEPEEKDEGWNIYHIPTSACFSNAVPADLSTKLSGEEFIKFLDKGDFDYDKPELLRWMACVQNVDDGCYEFERANMSPINITGRMLKKYWDELRLLTSDTYQDNGNTAKEIIQKWCLSVKVE